nr:hypothetical protein ACMD2_00257 [Ipomoea trifida]
MSTIKVPMAATIATKPVNGKFCQDFSGKLRPQEWTPARQELVRVSNASGNTWMNPVDRITPAKNALTNKNKYLSGRKAGTTLLVNIKETPKVPPTRMDAIAMNFNFSASELF